MTPVPFRTIGAFACAGALFPVALLAQTQTIVSPIAATTTEGGSGNSFPWVNTTIRRYMQVHSDLQGSVRVIQKLAWRRDGTAAFGSGSRTVDVELAMGPSVDYDKVSFVTSSNYTAAPTVVLPRQVVNLPSLTSTTSPAAFEIALPLATPFTYLGSGSLAWEAKVFSNVAVGTYTSVLDAHGPGITAGTTPSTTGTGCVATGQAQPMQLTISHADSAGLYHLGCYVERCPANAPVVLALGTANPALSVPGLCGLVHTDLAAVVPAGTSSPTGLLANVDETSILRPAPSLVFATQNLFPTAVLYLQAHAIDAGSTNAIPVASSDGKAIAVPTPNLALGVAKVTRISNNGNGTLATQGIYFSTTSFGYGIVTEFTY